VQSTISSGILATVLCLSAAAAIGSAAVAGNAESALCEAVPQALGEHGDSHGRDGKSVSIESQQLNTNRK